MNDARALISLLGILMSNVRESLKDALGITALLRTWPKLTGDIITDVSNAERIFYRGPDISHQCPEHRSLARDIVDQ